jgi:hypothetical protein
MSIREMVGGTLLEVYFVVTPKMDNALWWGTIMERMGASNQNSCRCIGLRHSLGWVP